MLTLNKEIMKRQINIVELKQGGDCDTLKLKIDNNLEIEIGNFDGEITIDINKITLTSDGFEVVGNKSSSSFVKATEQLNDLASSGLWGFKREIARSKK
jgi:hypothetical protein